MISGDPRPGLLRKQLRLPRPAAHTVRSMAGLTLLVLFFVREAVFGGRVFYVRDIHLQWYGQMETFVRAVASGSWPLWDPYVSFGQPLLANANNQILYPITWLNLVVRPWTYYTFFLALHLLFSAVGVLALGKRLGVSPMGSFVAAALWTASGPFLSLGNLWNHLAGAAWVPWALVAAHVAWESGTLWHALVWGATMAAQVLAGSPEFFAATAFLTAAMGPRAIRGTGASPGRRAALAAVVALVFAIALSAGQALPSLELASRSGRWSQAEGTRAYWSVHPATMLQVLLPVAWDELPLQQRYRDSLFEGREPYLFSLHLGLPALALALAAFCGPRRPMRAFLAITAVAAALLALGRHALVYDAAVSLLPPLKVLRFPAKAMVIAALSTSILAGMGFDAWREPSRSGPERRFRWIVLGPLLLAASAIGIGALLALREAEALGQPFLDRVGSLPFAEVLGPVTTKLEIVAALGFAIVVFGWARGGGPRWARASAGVVASFALADLLVAHKDLNPTAPQEIYTARPAALDVIRQQDHRRLFVYDYLATPGLSERYLKRAVPYPGARSDSPLLWTSAMAMRLILLPPTLEAWGLYDSYSRDALGVRPRPLAELNALLVGAEGTPLFTRLLRLGAVSQVLALHEGGFEDLVPAATLRGPYAEPIRIFQVPGSLPRTYMVGGARIAQGETALEALADPGFDPAVEVVIDQGRPRDVGRTFVGRSRIRGMGADRIALETDANEDGYAVLVDAFDPGWKASVDGKDRPLLRANLAFRAIEVPRGRHAVELAYRPRAVAAGIVISFTALLASTVTVLRVSRH
jgi:hypothetical protein